MSMLKQEVVFGHGVTKTKHEKHAQRFTIAIIPTSQNSANVGVSLCGVNELYIKKTGRAIAEGRARKKPTFSMRGADIDTAVTEGLLRLKKAAKQYVESDFNDIKRMLEDLRDLHADAYTPIIFNIAPLTPKEREEYDKMKADSDAAWQAKQAAKAELLAAKTEQCRAMNNKCVTYIVGNIKTGIFGRYDEEEARRAVQEFCTIANAGRGLGELGHGDEAMGRDISLNNVVCTHKNVVVVDDGSIQSDITILDVPHLREKGITPEKIHGWLKDGVLTFKPRAMGTNDKLVKIFAFDIVGNI